ncbi:MAG: hypothetical protein WD358_01635 [Nitriliruptoraceae bacterium]
MRAFRHRMIELGVPRSLITPHLIGRTIGPAGDPARQRAVVAASIDLLETATEPGTLVDFEPSHED